MHHDIYIILPCSHEIQDDHILNINKTEKKKRIKPNSQIKTFTLSYPLTKLLILQVWLFQITQKFVNFKQNGLPITFNSFNSSFTGYV